MGSLESIDWTKDGAEELALRVGAAPEISEDELLAAFDRRVEEERNRVAGPSSGAGGTR